MFKSPKKTPKKNDLADVLSRITLDIEYAEKKHAQDLKSHRSELARLTCVFEQIENILKKPATCKISELHKQFSGIKAGILRVNKEIESSQKHFHKAELDFEKKLHAPFANGDFNDQTSTILEEAKTAIAKFTGIFYANKLALEETIDISQKLSERTVAIEEDIHKICLPEELCEAAKINQKLNERIEVLCQETANLHLSNEADKVEATKIATSILQLYAAHKKGEKLLDQIQKNLQVNVTVAASSIPAEKKEELAPK